MMRRFFTLTNRASTEPSNIRGCQSGTWSAGQKKIRGTSTKLQREHKRKRNETKQKRQKEKNNNKIHMPEKDRRRAFDREFGIMPAASHPIPSPDRNHAPKRVASTTLRTLRVSVYSNGTVDVAVLGLVQSTRLENVSSLLPSPQVRPQPCTPLPLLPSSADD